MLLAFFLLTALGAPSGELSLEMWAEVEVRPPAGPLILWMPVPTTDSSQLVDLKALEFSTDGSNPAPRLRLTRGGDGNRYLVTEAEGGEPFRVRYRVPILRKSAGYQGEQDLEALISRVLAKYQVPSLHFPFSESIEQAMAEGALASEEARRTLAGIRESASRAGGSKLERAILLNELLRRNGKYIKLGAYGRGSSEWFCLTGQGNCTDFHFTFLDAARELGISARLRIGIPLKPELGAEIASEGKAPGYHCWIYLDEPGFEADPSWESRLGRSTGYYFGERLNDRLKITEGSSLSLEPPQAGPPLPYLFEAYAEAGGKPLPRYYGEVPAESSGPHVVTRYGFRLR